MDTTTTTIASGNTVTITERALVQRMRRWARRSGGLQFQRYDGAATWGITNQERFTCAGSPPHRYRASYDIVDFVGGGRHVQSMNLSRLAAYALEEGVLKPHETVV